MHVPIFWEVCKNKTYADYSTNSWQSSHADLRSNDVDSYIVKLY